MCEYCDKEKTMLIRDIISTVAWGWGDLEITLDKAERLKDTFGLFIDKRCNTGYLRFANLEDCNCIESGEKIEINFCPICGEKLN